MRSNNANEYSNFDDVDNPHYNADHHGNHDPDTIADNTTVKETARRPTGIENVVINGEMVVESGKYIKDKKAGQVVRFR